jgi:hypothetical protein
MLTHGRRADTFRSQRQLYDEAGADRLVFLYADGAVVIFNDAADNS